MTVSVRTPVLDIAYESSGPADGTPVRVERMQTLDTARWHPRVARLYRYWLSIHPPGGGLPGRQHFDPVDVPELLPGSIVRVNRLLNAFKGIPVRKIPGKKLFLVEHSGGMTC